MTDATRTTERVLEVKGLRTYFRRDGDEIRSVDGVDFHVDAAETVGLVGESGSGKSVTALSIMRLVPAPPGRHAGGSVRFEGRDMTTLDTAALRALRGDRLSMIFQEPMTSLNPTLTIGEQIAEALRLHRRLGRQAAFDRAVDMMRLVRIPEPEQRAGDYPHRLSGGMRQRVMIAIALACRPRLLIADEPTTALDVTIQAQILDLIRRHQAEIGMAVLLITHDLGVVAQMCDRVLVMYAGRIVEEAPVLALFDRPLHPYTEGLMASIPRLDVEQDELQTIEGNVPDPSARQPGCAFAPRCPYVFDRCLADDPALLPYGPGLKAACHRAATRASTGSFT